MRGSAPGRDGMQPRQAAYQGMAEHEHPGLNLRALAEFAPIDIPPGPPGRLELAISILNATSAPAVIKAIGAYMDYRAANKNND